MGLNDVDLDNDPNGLEACQKPENHTFLTGIDDWSRLRYSRHGLVGWDEQTYGDAETRSVPTASALAAAIDTDGDGIDDDKDVCPAAADPGQEDTDKDGLGDACLPFITQRDVSLSSLTAASANVPVGETRTVEVDRPQLVPEAGDRRRGRDHAARRPDSRHAALGGRRDPGARLEDSSTLKVTGVDDRPRELTAEVVAATEPDFDSTPDNHDATEDDQASKRLTVFAGRRSADGGRARPVRPRGRRRRGDRRSCASSVDAQTGMSVEGRLRSVGGTATPGEDYKPIDIPDRRSRRYTSEAPSRSRCTATPLDEPDETIELELRRHRRRATGDGARRVHDHRRRRPAPAGRAGLSRLRLARLRAGQVVRAARAQARLSDGRRRR